MIAWSCVSWPVVAEAGPLSAPASRIKAHLQTLADDRMEGRGPGTRGFNLAAHYVATQLQAFGLRPAVSDGWYQQVPLVERRPNSTGLARIQVGTAVARRSAVGAISGEGSQRWNGEAVFVGYGLVSPEHGIDDYAGLDVRGKAVVLYDAAPASLPADVAASLGDRRADIAFAHGAVGLITLLEPKEREKAVFDEYRASFNFPFFNWVDASGEPFRRLPMRFSAVLWPDAARALFANAPTPFATVDARAARGEALAGFALKPQFSIASDNRWRRFSSPNVIGMIPGSDPALSNEVVLVTAHLDHLGIDPSVAGEDKIFNGARDNASGVAAMLEVARAIAAGNDRARRTILFAAVTAEEVGLLGSDYLADHPVLAGSRVVAVVNLDGGVPLDDIDGVRTVGGWHSTIGGLVAAVAARKGLGVDPDRTGNDDFFSRTDHFSFARRGVPAVYLVPGSSNAPNSKVAYDRHNHQPSDDLRLPFQWEAGARFADVTRDIVSALADAPEAPRWYLDSMVAARFAPGQAKAERPKPAASAPLASAPRNP